MELIAHSLVHTSLNSTAPVARRCLLRHVSSASVTGGTLVPFGAVHDVQIEDPLSHSTSTVFPQSDMGSRVHLQGIHKIFGDLEAGVRIWNIPVYVHRGAADEE